MIPRALAALCILLCVAASPALAAGARESTGDRRLEIFSWWTAGGEAEGLAAMFDIYRARFPAVPIINATVAGGAGSNAKAVLATRMQGGTPPDSFQVHAGHELIDSWVVAGKMEPITFIFRDNGWLGSFPKGLLDIISWKGEIYSVPVNIHRSNVLWYNKKIFAASRLAAAAHARRAPPGRRHPRPQGHHAHRAGGQRHLGVRPPAGERPAGNHGAGALQGPLDGLDVVDRPRGAPGAEARSPPSSGTRTRTTRR